MNEFDAIEKYFRPLTMDRPEALGLSDDAAVLDIPAGQELVITTDTLNAGTHFMEGAQPADIAHKALRVNLSDIAAMGARPHSYQLAIAFPEKPSEEWLAAFTVALLADQQHFSLFCSGGDTTTINGPLSISITMMGLVPRGKAIKRSGAKPGDDIYISGPVGDAYIGLKILQGALETENNEYFIEKYYKPTPRLDMIDRLHNSARACADISDGLIADLNHICTTSQVHACISLQNTLFSKNAARLIKESKISALDLISGGDDYELVFATPPDAHIDSNNNETGPIKIGTFKKGPPKVQILDAAGAPIASKQTGWSHF